MSGMFGQTGTFRQENETDIELVVFGDRMVRALRDQIWLFRDLRRTAGAFLLCSSTRRTVCVNRGCSDGETSARMCHQNV
jgi:hypothetical protein